MKTAIRIANLILILCITLSCVTIAYADVDTAHNIIASVEVTEPVASEFVMVEELFTSTIERIDGVTMYTPEEPQELAPPIAIMKPDVSVEMPTEPEPLAPPIAPTEHKCCPAAVCVPATCTTDGYFKSVCDCGYTYREEYAATGHDWGDWHTTKLMTFTPGSMLRECKNCGIKESEMFMDEINTISIPSLRLNSTFLNTVEGGSIGNSDVIYYTANNHPVITGKLNLEELEVGNAIYLNTNDGLKTYRVEVSELGVSNGADIIGQTSGTNIWTQNENDLCMYAVHEGGYWMVIASVFEA
jgi:hypothetical protein